MTDWKLGQKVRVRGHSNGDWYVETIEDIETRELIDFGYAYRKLDDREVTLVREDGREIFYCQVKDLEREEAP